MKEKELRIIIDAAACAELLDCLDSCLFLDGIFDRVGEVLSKEDYEKFEKKIDSIVTEEIDELKQFLSNIAQVQQRMRGK